MEKNWNDITFYIPKTEIKGSVVVVHGMSEHHERYHGFALYLQNHGYGVALFDLPGHGKMIPASDLGHFERGGWEKCIERIHEVIGKTNEMFPGVKHYLFGHSMGSMLSRCYLQEHDTGLDGCILSGAPCYQSAVSAGIGIGKMLTKIKGERGKSRLMDAMVTGGFLKSVKHPETPHDWISYNKDNIKAYCQDPLCGFPFTVQGYVEELCGMQKMADINRYHCTRPNLPILFVAGADDPCTGGVEGLNSSEETLRKAGYTSIETIVYPKMRHEILNETEKEKVMKDIVQWLDAHK